MKIGLLTYHNSTNYGAVLQCYATCRALKELGHEVEIINFCQDEKKSSRSFMFYFKVKNFFRFMGERYPKLSDPIDNIEILKKKVMNYDCLMVGSDQVWNPQIACDKLEAYFLNFGSEVMKRVSYASSFGIGEWPEEKNDLVPIIKQSLSRFNAISVREETGKQIIADKFGLSSEVVLDPTLLHRGYAELTGEVVPNHSIICYLLNRSKKQLEKVKHLASLLGMKPRMMSTIHYVKGFTYTYPPSIENWLRYIAGAEFVVTDSFHGLAFSLIYNKQFVVISPNNGKNSRLLDLLKLVGLENRHFFDDEDVPYNELISEKINYTEVNKRLDKMREKSWEFMKEALKEA